VLWRPLGLSLDLREGRSAFISRFRNSEELLSFLFFFCGFFFFFLGRANSSNVNWGGVQSNLDSRVLIRHAMPAV